MRNYNANSHLHSLNIHRYNSLRSFETIVRNNTLPENRDDIVKQVAQTIFSHQQDGFLPEKGDEISLKELISLLGNFKK